MSAHDVIEYYALEYTHLKGWKDFNLLDGFRITNWCQLKLAIKLDKKQSRLRADEHDVISAGSAGCWFECKKRLR